MITPEDLVRTQFELAADAGLAEHLVDDQDQADDSDVALWAPEKIAQYHADEERDRSKRQEDARQADMRGVAHQRKFLERFILDIRARDELRPEPSLRGPRGRQPDLWLALRARAATCETLRAAFREQREEPPARTRLAVAAKLYGAASDEDAKMQHAQRLNRIAKEHGFDEYMRWAWLLTRSPAEQNHQAFGLASLTEKRLDELVEASHAQGWLQDDWDRPLHVLKNLEDAVSVATFVEALERASILFQAPPLGSTEDANTKAARAQPEKWFKTQARGQVVDLIDAWKLVKHRLGLFNGFVLSATTLQGARNPQAIERDRDRVARYRFRKSAKATPKAPGNGHCKLPHLS